MLLFSFLWLDATQPPPKPSGKTSSYFSAAAASSSSSFRLDGTTVKRPLHEPTATTKNIPSPKPAGKKVSAEKQEKLKSSPDSSIPCCSCCCGLNSSNAPDKADALDDFFKPQEEEVQEILRELEQAYPQHFARLLQKGFLKRTFDDTTFYFGINPNWHQTIKGYFQKLESTQCQSKVFSIGVFALNIVELLAVSYFTWGENPTAVFSLGLSSIGLSILGSLADYIKANTLDSEENEAGEVLLTSMWFYSEILTYIEQEEQEEEDKIDRELRKLAEFIRPDPNLAGDACCSSNCSCGWWDSVKKCFKHCVFGEHEQYSPKETANSLREKEQVLDEEHSALKERSHFHRLGSLLFGIGTSVVNEMSNALFVGTSLASRYAEKITQAFNLSALNETVESLLFDADDRRTSQTFKAVRIISLVATVIKPVYTLWNFYISGKTKHVEDQKALLTKAILSFLNTNRSGSEDPLLMASARSAVYNPGLMDECFQEIQTARSAANRKLATAGGGQPSARQKVLSARLGTAAAAAHH